MVNFNKYVLLLFNYFLFSFKALYSSVVFARIVLTLLLKNLID